MAISPETRARVLAAAKELGYVANPVARALRTGRTNAIGLSVAELSQPFSVVLLTSLVKVVEEANWATMLMQSGAEPASPAALREALAMWPVDGVIAQATPVWVQSFRAVNEARRLPFVRLDSQPPNDNGDYVAYLLEDGAMAAARHLVDVGCRQIAFVAPEYGIGPECRRQGSYLQVMAEAGLRPISIDVEYNTCAGAWEAVSRALAHAPAPDGFLCYNDDLAAGTIRALADAGRRVPRDAAVVGFDDLPSSNYAVPRLTTVRLPVQEITATAWDFLSRRLADPALGQQGKLFTTELVVRESSRLGVEL